MNRNELFEALGLFGACGEARDLTLDYTPSRQARDIWDQCNHPGWLLWLPVRLDLERRRAGRVLLGFGEDNLDDLPQELLIGAARGYRREIEAWARTDADPPETVVCHPLKQWPGWQLLYDIGGMALALTSKGAANSADDAITNLLPPHHDRGKAWSWCNTIRAEFSWEEIEPVLLEALRRGSPVPREV